jgi:Tfp pilus assembly protein PilV
MDRCVAFQLQYTGDLWRQMRLPQGTATAFLITTTMQSLHISESARARAKKLRSQGGFTIAEQIVALGVIGIGMIAVLQAISFMQFENRASSQRMLAASIELEILELFKTLPFAQITNSTTGTPIYLKKLAGGSANTSWIVPAINSWQNVPVEDTSSGSAADPTLLADKLPGAQWRADFTTDATDATLRQVKVTMRWRLYGGTSRNQVTLQTSTIVAQAYPNL